mgnify:FL=1|tara:strand:- start:43 stop:495 length:453 start_codon:yes stop_codon:yes gene_type:complete
MASILYIKDDLMIEENFMKNFKNVSKYSKEYDEFMKAELEIVKDAYNYYDKNGSRQYTESPYPKYSIKLPNKMTGMRLVDYMDGTQPCYDNTAYLNMLEQYDIYHDESLADYPRHDNTKRIFYSDLEKAQAALYFLKKHNDLINQTKEDE